MQFGQELVVVDGLVYDVDGFADDHPGGRAMVKSVLGRDATGVFNGGVWVFECCDEFAEVDACCALPYPVLFYPSV